MKVRVVRVAVPMLVLAMLTVGCGTFRSVTVGNFHSCALTTSGGVKCWGYNAFGQLGDGTQTNRTQPVGVVGLSSGVTALASGTSQVCALLTEGAVKCWGNSAANPGSGGAGDSSTPVEVQLGGPATSLAAGAFHRCALLANGGVKCWGSDSYGQLGDGRTTATSGPVDVQGLSGPVTAVAAGAYFTCAQLTSGAVQCWGRNANGTVGDGTTTDRYIATQASGLLSGATALAAYEEHACAVVAGAARCWGQNTNGQLGDNSTTNRSTPVAVVGMNAGVASIASGGEHSCALTTGGSVKCWGRNSHGELGDNSTTGSLVPVQVSGLTTGITAIAAGAAHSCAVRTLGLGTCWGYNGEGQLGNSSTNSSLVPVTVVGS